MYVALSVCVDLRSIDDMTPPIASNRFVLSPAILSATRSIDTALQGPHRIAEEAASSLILGNTFA